MASRFAEYKKRRLIGLQQRIKELEAEVIRLNNENVELKAQIHYWETRNKR
jgi:cell division protein FtsB